MMPFSFLIDRRMQRWTIFLMKDGGIKLVVQPLLAAGCCIKKNSKTIFRGRWCNLIGQILYFIF
jgi:hypothetical protein